MAHEFQSGTPGTGEKPPIAGDPGGAEAATGLRAVLDLVERDLILNALKASRGNKAKAAQALGITERLMGIRVKKYGIDWRSYRARR